MKIAAEKRGVLIQAISFHLLCIANVIGKPKALKMIKERNKLLAFIGLLIASGVANAGDSPAIAYSFVLHLIVWLVTGVTIFLCSSDPVRKIRALACWAGVTVLLMIIGYSPGYDDYMFLFEAGSWTCQAIVVWLSYRIMRKR